MSIDARRSLYEISVDKAVINEIDNIKNLRNVHKNHTFFVYSFLKATSRGKVHTSKLVAIVCCEYLQLAQYQSGHRERDESLPAWMFNPQVYPSGRV